MQKITSSLLISALIIPHGLFAADLSNLTCPYADNYNKCVQANEDGSARSIEDFVCIEQKGGGEQMLLQIILDDKFKEVDEQAEEYLEKLEQDKEAYFGNEPQANFLTAIDDITANFGELGVYSLLYKNIYQQEVISEYIECVEEITTDSASDFLANNNLGLVDSLVKTKLDIYRQVAYNILKINRLAIRQDDRKTYVIEQRDKYSGVMQLMLNILGYLERIVNGWPTKTKKPHVS